ncbi:MAG: 16S rRNA (adenine(1518)-N(6)/adenine(1519)-N(6))-dimethyltransferase RsmA [Clostridia bacterium]|nr:16S rRNA (adenine(1518)-N(6)/adenine(1519)-N(6))-dimethyltransferase RsmA [Clostridia bacterium]
MEINNVLRKYNFRFKKSLGQNFISDTGLLEAIVKDADIQNNDLVLEIGAGAGTLTRALTQKAEKVIAFDVDEALGPILAENLTGIDNVEVYFRDILKMSDDELAEITEGKRFKVVANLPYYITTPLIMRFIESNLPVDSLTVMVQKEVADRLTARASTPEYGAITLAVKLRGETKVVRKVSRNMFFPAPNVDSAVIHIVINSEFDQSEQTKTLKRLIKAGFAMRRKTLANNIAAAFPVSKQRAAELIKESGLNEQIRGEALTLEDYKLIVSKLLSSK